MEPRPKYPNPFVAAGEGTPLTAYLERAKDWLDRWLG